MTFLAFLAVLIADGYDDSDVYYTFTSPIVTSTSPSQELKEPQRYPQFQFVPRYADSTEYCQRTNPTLDPWGSEFVWCIGGNTNAPEQFQLVVTASESDIVAHPDELSWLNEIPLSKVVYVKSNFTKSFRANGMKWVPNHQTVMNEEGMFHDGAQPSGNVPHRIFRSSLRDNATLRSDTVVRELPNIGDEALSILTFIAEFYATLKPYTVFVHGHRASWHATDIVEQLSCLCLAPTQENYRTLTTPQRAFLFQCMPLQPPNCSEILLSSTGRPAALQEFEARMCKESVNATLEYRMAFELLFGQNNVPVAVVRDCCASFVVSRAAIHKRPRSFYERLAHRVRSQPDREFLQHSLKFELSMYLERFWRHVFDGESGYDFFRDFAAARCKYKEKFDCPPSIKVASSADVPPEHRERKCADGISNPYFG